MDSSIKPQADTELSLANPASEAESPCQTNFGDAHIHPISHTNLLNFSKGGRLDVSESQLRPIKGIPVYSHSTSSFPFPSYYNRSSLASWVLHSPVARFSGISMPQYEGAVSSSRFMPRLQSKRTMRAPRMRWTSSLHARFVHAVELAPCSVRS
ncbi:hypothetical protein V6N13_041960 [Hibiscus sabdariffa]|uniref:Uncharacterized protein n=1 Tax=Hibiscus sabdariffa TaxID=183260 RepID=A0ABR2DEL2_9ROSI